MSIKSIAKSPFLFGSPSEARNKMAEQQTTGVTGAKVTTGLESLLGSIKEGSYWRSEPTSAGGDLIPPGAQSRIIGSLNEGSPSRLDVMSGLFNNPDIKYKSNVNKSYINNDFLHILYLEENFGKVERHRRKALKRFNKAAKQAVKQFLNK